MKKRIITGPFFFQRKAVVTIDAKLPEMRRAVQRNGTIDQEARTMPIIYATEAPVDRWFGREKLICSPDAMRLERLNTLGAFLSEHDRDKQIGVVVKDSMSFSMNRQALASVRFSANNPLAEQEWKDVNDGIRGLFSVGYMVHRLVLVEENDAEGDLYEARDWEPLEISLVAIPADIDCQPDCEMQKSFTNPVKVITENTKAENTEQLMNRNKFYFARYFRDANNGGGRGEGGSSGGIPAAAVPPAAAEDPKKAIEAERARCKELNALGLRFGCAEQMSKMIEDGSLPADAYRWMMENKVNSSNGGGGNASGANGNRALLTAGADGSQFAPVARSIGQMLIEHAQFKEFTGQGQTTKRAGFEFPLTSFRATLLSTGPAQGAGATQILPGIVELNQQRLTIADLIAPGTTGGNKIEYMQETAYANGAATVAEGAAKPEATFTLAPVDSPVRKIAVTAKVSDEMLQDYAYIQSYVDARMQFMVGEKEEGQLLYGDGNSPNITGFMNVTGIQTQAMGDDSQADAIHKGITKCRVNAHVEPTAVVIHPNDWEKIKLSKDANGQYIAGGPFYTAYGVGGVMVIDRIWGLPLVVTTAIVEGTALVGAFRTQSQLFRRQGITIETTNSNEDDFKNNLVAIRAEERLALCVYRPLAFVTITGLNA